MLDVSKLCGALALLAVAIVGCGESNPAVQVPPTRAEQTAPDATYLLSEKPAHAKGVGEVRTSDDREVTVVGRIGGDEKPFIDGIAAFTIVDPKVPHCSPEEGCETPWDYCCTQNEVKGNKAMVKIVDRQGQPVMKDAKALLGVKELSMVVVRGKAERDEEGNLTVLADHVFVEKE
jgi:hypothetical protein